MKIQLENTQSSGRVEQTDLIKCTERRRCRQDSKYSNTPGKEYFSFVSFHSFKYSFIMSLQIKHREFNILMTSLFVCSVK